jgi:enhancing lycopene biosynthesis protein 2
MLAHQATGKIIRTHPAHAGFGVETLTVGKRHGSVPFFAYIERQDDDRQVTGRVVRHHPVGVGPILTYSVDTDDPCGAIVATRSIISVTTSEGVNGMKKIAVVLSGCGVFDGSEIYESVLTLLRLEHNGVQYQCLAPNVEQLHVINHLTGEVAQGERRNVLVEAARLARGEIEDLATADPAEFDALIIPGGFGAAKNLSDFAIKGADCTVIPQLVQFARAIHAAGKPVGLICIAPTLTPKLLGPGIRCTVGNDSEVAGAIERMGGEHASCSVDQIVVDPDKRVVSTPAYMLARSISEAASGINRLVDEVVKMA